MAQGSEVESSSVLAMTLLFFFLAMFLDGYSE